MRSLRRCSQVGCWDKWTHCLVDQSLVSDSSLSVSATESLFRYVKCRDHSVHQCIYLASAFVCRLSLFEEAPERRRADGMAIMSELTWLMILRGGRSLNSTLNLSQLDLQLSRQLVS